MRYLSEGSHLSAFVQAHFPITFESKALELVARRVSAVSGDMRSAIAVCSSARAAAARAAAAALASPSAPGAASPGGAAARSLITVSQVAAALAACRTGGGAEAQGHVKLIQALPVQQQLLVCTLAIARGSAAGASAAPSMTPSMSATATSCSAVTPTPVAARPALSTARSAASLRTPPLGASRQGNLHSLLNQSQTPVGTGFGLATPRPASKPVFKSFPMVDDVPGMTPTAAAPPALGGKGARGKAAMSMEEVYRKYTGSGKEAGIAVVDWPGLEMLVGLLCESGLLEVTAAKGRGRGRREQFAKDTLVKLKVGTDDVKHALAGSHLLLPLVAQLP